MLAAAPEAYSAEKEESDDDMGFGLFDDDSPTGMATLAAPVTHIGAYVNSKGNINASFRIPGLVSVPGTGEEKTFTIAEPELEATISWFSIPKADLHTHMKVGHLFDIVLTRTNIDSAGLHQELFRFHATPRGSEHLRRRELHLEYAHPGC